jgi:hypothetical protein
VRNTGGEVEVVQRADPSDEGIGRTGNDENTETDRNDLPWFDRRDPPSPGSAGDGAGPVLLAGATGEGAAGVVQQRRRVRDVLALTAVVGDSFGRA